MIKIFVRNIHFAYICIKQSENNCLHTVGWWNLADTPPRLGGEDLGNTVKGK